jgi:hypothetical protein
MKPFEFVLVIISVIIGLVLTEFAIGISYMIQYYRTAIYYWPHIAFLGFGFIGCLNYWGSLYRLRNLSTWTVPQMGMIFTTGLFFCISSQIITPDENNFDHNYKRYFHENANVLYSLLICLVTSLMIETYLIKKVRRLKWYLVMSINISLALSGMVIDNENYKGALAVILLIVQIYNMYSTRVIIDENVA